jgi:SAM-dependent methyltransferase
MTTRHLDLGCGARPRNPYRRDEIHGIDINPRSEPGGFEIREANLALEPIPYPDSHFHSVSAYDFLEHVPRVLTTADGRATRFPFVELMNEVWRVLQPGGRFYGYTPCYPHPMAFQDPTHVNIVTRDTHRYFTRPDLTARMYGFRGNFSVVRVLPALSAEHEYEPTEPARGYQKFRLMRRRWRNENSHIVWEFEAHK